jgi:hydrogenase maturation protease
LSAIAANPTPATSPSLPPVVVLGIGNVLMGDDGIGVHVVAALDAARATGHVELAPGVELVDAGTAGLALLPWLAEARGAVIVDAAGGCGGAGTVAVWRDGEAVERSTVEIGPGVSPVGELLAIARLAGALPAALSVVGIEPQAVAPGERLSVTVAAAIPAAIEATLAEIERVDALSGSGAPTMGSLAERSEVTA